jgi:enoyl-[acyl-carrier protein] reductase II
MLNSQNQYLLTTKAMHFAERFNLRLPIIQAGMVWASGHKLAAACANAGIIGTLGAGSMTPDLLDIQLAKAKAACQDAEAVARLAVNFPLLYSQIETQINTALQHEIKIFITSAGSPKTWTKYIQARGGVVIHVVSHPKLAQKCIDAGVDIVVAEGFEAGGHNGREELTTMSLIPMVHQVLPKSIPLVAAGGIMDGRSLVAALALGASAVQMGTRFLLSQESSAHERFKNLAIQTPAGETQLVLKKQVPVRLLRNEFCRILEALEAKGANREDLEAALGKGRAKAGILEGDLEQGELEIGQGHALVKEIKSCEQIVTEIELELRQLKLEFLPH